MDIALTEPQEEFVFSQAPFVAMVAGLGAGKSHAAIVRCWFLLMEQYNETGKTVDVLYTMPTYDLLKLRAIPGFEELLSSLGIKFATNKSDYYIDTGIGRVLFRSYDRPERIVAFEVAHAVCDELDTLPADKSELVWRKINERVRQKAFRPNSIAVPTTPDQGYNGIVYKKWYNDPANGYEYIEAPTYSNPFLPDDYVEQIRANYDALLADMYIEGKIVNLSANKVYHFFDRVVHHSDRELTDKDRDIFVSIDFNVGGCCATTSILEKGKPVVVDEFTSKNTYDFISNLNNRYPDKRIVIYPDASGDAERTNATKSDISLIKEAGYRVDAPRKNPFVRDRVNAVNKMLCHNEIKINTHKCPELTHALETQAYTDKGEPEKFKDHPAIDDWVDSFGYFISKRYPVKKPVSRIDSIGFAV